MKVISMQTIIKHPLVFSQLLLHSLWLLTLALTLPLSIAQFMLALVISLVISGLTTYAVYRWLNTLQHFKSTISALAQGRLHNRFQADSMTGLNELATTLNGVLQQYEDLLQTQQQAQSNWQTTTENLAIVMWEWDLEADSLQFSNQWQTLLGGDVNSLNLSSQAWKTRLHPDDLQPTLIALDMHLQQKSLFFENMHRLRHQAGYYIWVWLRGKAFYQVNGKACRIVGLYQEMTIHKHQENTLFARLQKTLNESSQAVLDTLNLIQTLPLTVFQQQQISIIKNAVELMGYPLADVMAALSHTTFSISGLKSVPITLNAVLDDSLGVFAVAAAKKHIHLIAYLEANVPLSAKGDKIRLRYMLMGLLSNALKFTTQGDIVLHISVLEKQAQQVLLRFEVQDSGVGMTPEQYAQLTQTLLESNKNCGHYADANIALGLQSVKHWATQMGGEFGIHHSLKQGCRAWFSIGLTLSQVPTDDANDLALLAKRTAIIIETHPLQRNSLIALLQRWEMQIVIADSYNVVLEKLPNLLEQHSVIDIVLISLPHTEAQPLQTLTAFSSLACPIIVLTPLLDPANPERAFPELEISKHSKQYFLISKPIYITVLQMTLLQALQQTVEKNTSEAVRPHQKISPISTPLPIPTASPPVASETKPESAKTELRILVVEDSPMNREVITDMLQRLHYQADMAENGQQALEFYEKHTYDLIFMDCEMPVMDGYTATRTIREREQQQNLSHTPIIALTAHAMMQHRQLTQAAGMDDHISKPLRLNVLRKVLEHWNQQKATKHQPVANTEATVSSQLSTEEWLAAEQPSHSESVGETEKATVLPTVKQRTGATLHSQALEETSSSLQLTDIPALDIKALEVLRNVVGDDLSPFCQQFIEYAPKQAAILHESLQQQDSESLRRKAHQFKGESLQIGANRLAEVCKNIETQAQHGELADIASLLELLDNEVHNVITALQQVN